MTYAFNSTYDPPIPQLQIHLGVPDQEAAVGPISGIVDTGADGTIIPANYLQQLGAKIVDDAWIRSHWGE